MNLKRGKEIKDGNMLPISGSGPYRYNLAEQKTALYWVLSSDSKYNDYNFEVMGNGLKIGKFYSSPSGEILTFEIKLRQTIFCQNLRGSLPRPLFPI